MADPGSGPGLSAGDAGHHGGGGSDGGRRDSGRSQPFGGHFSRFAGNVTDPGISVEQAQRDVERTTREYEAARKQSIAKTKALINALGLIPVVGAPLAAIARAVTNLVDAFGLTEAQAQSAIQSLHEGKSPGEVGTQIAAEHGHEWTQQALKESGVSVPTDPLSDDFWGQFVQEWQSAKENIKLNDQFKKDRLQPAFDTYQQRLSGLSTEPTFAPINVGMGDFRTSFLTNRASKNANAILSSELAETDVMQPKKAEMDYLAQLGGLSRWQQELKNRINLQEIASERPGDSGTWLDAISDVIKVGSSGKDLFDQFFGD